MTLEDTFDRGFFLGAGNGLDHQSFTTGPPEQTYTLNAADVVPVKIASLKLDPGGSTGPSTRRPRGP